MIFNIRRSHKCICMGFPSDQMLKLKVRICSDQIFFIFVKFGSDRIFNVSNFLDNLLRITCNEVISSLEIEKWKLRFVHVILFGPKFVPSDELLIALTFMKLSAHLATSSNYISQFILCYYLGQLQNNTALRFILNIQLVWPMRLDIMIVGTMYKAMKCAQAQASTSLHAGWLDP